MNERDTKPKSIRVEVVLDVKAHDAYDAIQSLGLGELGPDDLIYQVVSVEADETVTFELR